MDKKFGKLRRTELLELLIEESEKNERLEAELAEAKKSLSSRELKMKTAGSIAEAALAVSGIFEAAEAACAQYKENIQRLTEEQNRINAVRDEESKRQAEQIISDARQRASCLEADVRDRCEIMIDLLGGEIAQFRQRLMAADNNTDRKEAFNAQNAVPKASPDFGAESGAEARTVQA